MDEAQRDVTASAETAAARVMAPPEKQPCPCCQSQLLSERAAFEICPVCKWEDDGQGDANEVTGGPNATSLIEARRLYREKNDVGATVVPGAANGGAAATADVGSCSSAQPDDDKPPMRLLCLHGYASNGATFVSAKAKSLAQVFVMAGIDGAVVINGAKHGMQRCWFQFHPPYPLKDRAMQPTWRAHERVAYVDCEAALDALVATWQNGSYDGVLGFSQGALTAAMLVARLELDHGSPRLRMPRLVILCNGFRTPLPSNPELDWWTSLPAGSLRTPAFVVKGANDPVDAGGQAELLAALFGTSRVHIVPNGTHAMPKEAADVAAITGFVSSLCAQEGVNKPPRLPTSGLRVDLRLWPTTRPVGGGRGHAGAHGRNRRGVALLVRCQIVDGGR